METNDGAKITDLDWGHQICGPQGIKRTPGLSVHKF